MTVSVTVESIHLATAANNALAFLPAASQIKVARVEIDPEGIVRFTATDTYAAGRDHAEVEDWLTPPNYASVLVSREALQELDAAGRKDAPKKKADGKRYGTLTLKPLDGLVFTPQEGEAIAHMDLTQSPENRPITKEGTMPADLFDAIDDALENPQEFRTAFQPQLLMRFSKVKADKDERVADLAIDDPGAPVLVKIGPTFKGLVMPVYREKHAENVGEEGLW